MTHVHLHRFFAEAPPIGKLPEYVVRASIKIETCWEEDDPPRLLLTDLEHPLMFRQRLEDWLKKQK